MDPLAGMDDSSTDDDTSSQATEDDPQVPENQAPPPAAVPVPPPVPAAGPRKKPHYALRHTLRGHTQSISAVKFSPDGKLLASCGQFCPMLLPRKKGLKVFDSRSTGAEKVVKIWSPETGEFLRNLSGHTQGLSDISWSSDSVYLASASDDTTIRIWDVETVRLRQYLEHHAQAFSKQKGYDS